MRTKVIITLIAVVFLSLAAFRIVHIKRARNAAPNRVESTIVRSARVKRADVVEKISFTGTIRPRNEVDVFTKLPGKIEKLLVQVGDKVKAGQIIAVVEHKEIEWQARASRAAVQVAQASLDGAKLEYDRATALFQGGSATVAQMEAAKVRYSLSEAQLAQAKASAGLAHENLANSTIIAPINGTITSRPVNIGTNLGIQNVVITIQDIATLKLEAAVDPIVHSQLKIGDLAQISADALPGKTFSGKLTILSPSLDQASRRAAVEIEIDNSTGELLPNTFAHVDVTTKYTRGALTIPRSALLESGGGAVAFRIRDGRVQKVQPKLGSTDRNLVTIIEGLQENDEVALTGQANLSNGSSIRIADHIDQPK